MPLDIKSTTCKSHVNFMQITPTSSFTPTLSTAGGLFQKAAKSLLQDPVVPKLWSTWIPPGVLLVLLGWLIPSAAPVGSH